MSIATDYGRIAEIETEIKTVTTRLAEHEKWLRSQILIEFGKSGTNANALAGLEVQKRLLPEWLKLKKAEIYRLQGQIESQKP
jgi:hypothetical protein